MKYPVRKLIAYTLLIYYVYTIVLAKPLLIYGNYLINYDFIVAELCEEKDDAVNDCKGRCQLEKQLSEAGDNQEQEPTPLPVSSKELSEASLQYREELQRFDFLGLSEKTKHRFFYNVGFSSWDHTPHTPPPENQA